jgi:hypothetical protein
MLENTDSEGVINETVEPQLTVVVNGVGYTEIPKKKLKKSKSNLETTEKSLEAGVDPYLAFLSQITAQYPGMGFGEKYVRKLPGHVNFVEEYGKVQLKQSKLCRWDRDEVVRLFEANYKLA